MSQRSGLSGVAAALNGSDHVELAFTTGDLERSLYLSLNDIQCKVFVERLVVNCDISSARDESYSGNG